jgi:hypothetical protein
LITILEISISSLTVFCKIILFRMIIKVQKIKIFEIFFNYKLTNSLKVIMLIFESLSLNLKIEFNSKWKNKIKSVLCILLKAWKKTLCGKNNRKAFIQKCCIEYCQFDLSILKEDLKSDVIIVMDIDPISLENLFINLRI